MSSCQLCGQGPASADLSTDSQGGPRACADCANYHEMRSAYDRLFLAIEERNAEDPQSDYREYRDFWDQWRQRDRDSWLLSRMLDSEAQCAEQLQHLAHAIIARQHLAMLPNVEPLLAELNAGRLEDLYDLAGEAQRPKLYRQ